ncbi:tRNA 2-thiouridine(34) synthase MnmA [Haloimpatiens sp. FM7315]|uniref:tRNA 2-thiouridine(34) synthase MnmA n=1 Tax=Haloimpatiens sp. FM7315 TaxID=3298609 RepID=UPI0035A323BE
MNKKVVIGMSGGVDSSVAAYLLKKQGYEVTGIMMRLAPDVKEYEECETSCCSLSAVDDARKVADTLEIPFYVMNFKEEFNNDVIKYFVSEYMKGRTPNPCIACNKHIKFDSFLRKSKAIGADYVATGHYARIEKVGDRYLLKKAADTKKDQSYVLYGLTQEQLAHTLMPCSKYSKEEIREIALKIGLKVYNKKDSQEICFIPDNDHGKFIEKYTGEKLKEGNFVDKNGNVLGRHKGIVYYTIGQRKGLNLALGRPVFVVDINPYSNEVVIGDEKDIFKTELIASKLNFIPFDNLNEEMEVEAKIRYSSKPCKAKIIPLEKGKVKVEFEEKQRAITRGQSVVFYKGDLVIGGGIIEKIL